MPQCRRHVADVEALEESLLFGQTVIEATQAGVEAWTAKVDQMFFRTLNAKGEAANSWYLGANVEGKARVPLFFNGSLGMYREELRSCAASGYAGFALS